MDFHLSRTSRSRLRFSAKPPSSEAAFRRPGAAPRLAQHALLHNAALARRSTPGVRNDCTAVPRAQSPLTHA